MLRDKDIMYERIEKNIKAMIGSRELSVGDRLLPERKMAARFKTSITSVRKGMERLIEQGILEKAPGKGTFVRSLPRINGQTNKIGVIFTHSMAGFFASSFYTAVMSGIAGQAHAEKKDILLRSLADRGAADVTVSFRELQDQVDGFIVADLMPHIYQALEPVLRQPPRPLVVLNYEDLPGTFDTVTTNSRENTRRLVQFLVDAGHRRIACLYEHWGEKLHPNYANRVRAFRETLQANALNPDERLIFTLGEEEEENLARVKKLMEPAGRPTALFCAGSFLAFKYFYPLARKLDLRIPDDLSVVAYDNVSECEAVSPALTCIDTNVAEIGRQGVRRLLEKQAELRQRAIAHYQTVLTGDVLPRESHCGPKH